MSSTNPRNLYLKFAGKISSSFFEISFATLFSGALFLVFARNLISSALLNLEILAGFCSKLIVATSPSVTKKPSLLLILVFKISFVSLLNLSSRRM